MAARRKTETPPDPPGPELAEDGYIPVVEVIARFQLETEGRVEAFKAQCEKRMGAAEHRAALLTDEVAALREEVAGLRRRFEGTEHELRAAVNECNTALRRAVEYAEQAKSSAAVYEKLRDAQPDYRAEVAKLRQELGGLLHRQDILDGQHATIQGATDRLRGDVDRVAFDVEVTARALDGGRFVRPSVPVAEVD